MIAQNSMSIACIFRGSRKWIFASFVTLVLALHTILSICPQALQGITHRLPSLRAPPIASDANSGPLPGQRILQDDPFEHDATTPALPLNPFFPDTTSEPPALDQEGDSLPPDIHDAASAPSSSIVAADQETPALVANAHTLPSADAFLPHFAQLSSVSNLTVREAMDTCQWSEQELTSFQFGVDAPWRKNLAPDIVIAYQRHQWQSFVQQDLIPWSSVFSKFEGRGIVIVAGHPKSMKRVKVVLRQLLALGSTVPVEINFFADELDETIKSELSSIYNHPDTKRTNLYFNDLASADQVMASTYNKKIKINYNLKTAALVNSRFAEPMLLDSDNVPAIDPALLWESKTYQEYGSVFWPDMLRTRKESPAWAITNTLCRRSEYEFETGQVLVDKRRLFYHLQLAAFWGEQPYWHDLLLGDKDLFRYAWHALQTEFGKPHKWITSVGFLAEQDKWGERRLDYCGHTFAQHHPDFKDGHMVDGVGQSGIAFFHGGTLKAVSAPLLTRLRENLGGIFTHYKRSSLDESWDGVEYDVGLRYWSAGYYYNTTEEPELTGNLDYDKDGIPMEPKDMSILELTEVSSCRPDFTEIDVLTYQPRPTFTPTSCAPTGRMWKPSRSTSSAKKALTSASKTPAGTG